MKVLLQRIISLKLSATMSPKSIIYLFFLLVSSSAFGQSWQDLDTEGSNLFSARRYTEAIEVFIKAEQQAGKEFGKNHKNYANAVQSLAVLYLYTGQYSLSEELYHKAIDIHKNAVGKNNIEYVYYLQGLATVYVRTGNNKNAIQTILEAMPVLVKVSGKKNEDYVNFINSLLSLYCQEGNYSAAEKMLLDFYKLQKEYYGESSPEYADASHNLFQLYSEQGNFVKAESFFQKTKRLRKTFNQAYWKTLDFNNMKYDYEINNTSDRITFWLDSLKSIEYKYGKSNQYYPIALLQLSILYQSEGKYNLAEPLFLEAIQYYDKKSLNYAYAINSMASMYQSMGNPKKTEKYYLEALEIKKSIQGPRHLSYGVTCNNLAIFYSDRGEYAKAETFYKIALLIFSSDKSASFSYYTGACLGLAIVYKELKKDSLAIAYYMESLEIVEMSYGKEHYMYGINCQNFASFYIARSNLELAESLLVKAKLIFEKTFNKDHVLNATIKYDLAKLYRSQGKYSLANGYFKESINIIIGLMNDNFGSLSEQEKNQYYAQVKQYYENYASFLLDYYPQDATSISDLNNLLLQTKNILFQSSLKVRENIIKSGDSTLITYYTKLTKQKNHLADVYKMSKSEKLDRGIDESQLEEQANETEKILTKRASVLKIDGLQDKKVAWEDVKNKLKKGEAAIEMTRVLSKNGDTCYVALIVAAETKNIPTLIVIKGGNEMETKFIKYYRNAIKNLVDDNESYDVYWRQLADNLIGIKKVYLSPDGVYNQISMPTLKNSRTGKYLFDEMEVQIIGSTKDLLKVKNNTIPVDTTVLLGFPNYKKLGKTKSDLSKSSEERSYSSTLPTDESAIKSNEKYFDRSTGSISQLPGTKIEVNLINELLKKHKKPSILLTEQYADEKRIKQLKNPDILHIATHGFFKPNQALKMKDNELSSSTPSLQNPLLQSGLLLAGCEDNFRSNTSTVGEEDGILTAYEATNLNLDGTNLVVLSACETGLGEIQNGEGVYGLQRAFQQAGAKSVLASLWKVNDNTTQLLMTTLYENYLKTGNLKSSFNKAIISVRRSYPEPYYWGAFVWIGK